MECFELVTTSELHDCCTSGEKSTIGKGQFVGNQTNTDVGISVPSLKLFKVGALCSTNFMHIHDYTRQFAH